MDSIRFNPSTQTFRPEVLNHRTGSPFAQNQISFHIGSAYLRDFTEKGIADFVSQHQPSGRNLSADEVRTFIQRVAANADQVKNVAFDLADPELGLAEKDGIDKRHLEGAFTLDMADRSVLPAGQAGQVRFVDVTGAHFDIKTKETRIAELERGISADQKQLDEAKSQLADKLDERRSTLEILPPGAQERLRLITERKAKINDDIAQLDLDKKAYEAEKAKPETSAGRKRELEFMLAGLPGEREKLSKEREQLDKQLSHNDGYLLQHESLNKLDRLNDEVSKLQERTRSLEAKLATGKQALADVKSGKPAAQPSAEKPQSTEQPVPAQPTADAAQPAGDAAKPAGDPVQPMADVQAGPGIDLAELRKQPPNHQATRLAALPPEQQKAAIAQLSPEERQQIQAAAQDYAGKLSTTQSVRAQKQLEAYKGLIQNLSTAPATQPAATQPASDKPATDQTGGSDTPAEDIPVAEQPAAKPDQPGPAPAKPDAPPVSPTPAATQPTNTPAATGDTIQAGGKPLTLKGQVITKESFKALSAADKFDVLMNCDEAYLRELLTSMGSERSQIRDLAQKYIDDYNQAHAGQAQSSTEANYAATHAGSVGSIQSNASIERARKIIQIINELDGVPAGDPSVATKPAETAAGQIPTIRGHRLEAKEFVYPVKPGDTARSLAKNEMGNEMFDYDIFDRNPGLDQAMKAAHNGQSFDRYDEDLSKYKEYQQLILSRSPKNPSPVLTSPVQKPPAPVQTNPAVSSEAVKPTETPKPAAEQPKPVAEQPKPVAEQPKPTEPEHPAIVEEPVTAKPAAEQPKPAAEQPKPAAEQPKPAAEQPKPAKPQSANRKTE